MKYYAVLLIFLLALSPNLFSQSVYGHRDQMDRFKNRARENYLSSQFDSAIVNWNLALHEARMMKDIEWQSRFMSSIAVGHKKLGDYDSALLYNDSAIILAETIELKSVLAACYNNVGNINLENGALSMAQENFLKAKQLKEQLGDTCSLASTLLNLGEIRKRLNDQSKAKEFYEKALVLRTSCKDTFGIISCIINLGLVAKNQNDTVTARKNFQKAERLAQTDPEKYVELQIIVHENMAQLLLNQLRFNEAINLNEKAYDMAVAYDLPYDQSHSLNQIGIANYHLNRLNRAEEFSKKAFGIAEAAGILENQLEAAENLVDVYQAWRKPEPAGRWLGRYKILRDSLLNASVMESIFDLGAKQEIAGWQRKTDAVQTELTLTQTRLEHERTLYMIAGFFLLVVIMAGAISFRQNNRRKAAELKAKEEAAAKREAELLAEGLRKENEHKAVQLNLERSERERVEAEKLAQAETAAKREAELLAENLEKKLEIERDRKVIVLNHEIKNEPEKFLAHLNFTVKELELIHVWFQTPGITEEAIAEKLYRTRDTIKTHSSNIRAKLDATNREDAMSKMIELAYQHLIKEGIPGLEAECGLAE